MADQFEPLPQRVSRPKRRRLAAADANPVVSQPQDLAREAQDDPSLAAEVPAGNEVADGHTRATNDEVACASKEGVPAYRESAVSGQKFEYLDHTADVQLHAWGTTLQEAFENVGLCMFNYMTPLEGIKNVDDRTIVAEGHDLPSLLYHWLDELLFSFATDFFVPTSLKIISLQRGDAESQQPNRPESDPNAPEERSSGSRWRIEAKGEGEVFDRRRHASGTEIKAITYSAMQINESEGDAEVFVIVDI